MKKTAAATALMIALVMILASGCVSMQIPEASLLPETTPPTPSTPQTTVSKNLSGVTKMIPGEAFDLDGDGSKETIQLDWNSESPDFTIIIGENSLPDQAMDPLSGDIYLADLRAGDGSLEIFVFTPGPSDDPETYWYYFKSGAINKLGTIPFNPEQMQVPGDGTVKGRTKAYFVETMFYETQYALNASGVFAEDRPEYILLNRNVNMLSDLNAYADASDTSAKNILFHQDEKVTLQRADLREWLEIVSRDEAGKAGWVRVREGFSIEGMPSPEVFSDLVMAD